MSARRERRPPLLAAAEVDLLPPACRTLYDVLMAQPDGYTFEVEYGEDDLGIGGTTMVTTSAVLEMMKEDWLELTILQLFSM